MKSLELEIRSYIIIFGLTFLITLLSGCQTTETAVSTSEVNLETKVEKLENELGKIEQQLSKLPKEPNDGSRGPKDELDKLEQQLKESKKIEKPSENPFSGKEIQPNQTVTSVKPIVCGRIDVILTNIKNKFGEVPIFVGKSETTTPIGAHYNMITLTYNKKTETFTFFEQMPLEERLLCMLASGKGRLSMKLLKGTAL